MEKVNFLIGLHCHQPVDNFRSIFEDAYNKSYEPFLNVLEKHPKIKLSLHFSGSLLDWIIKNKPAFIDRVKRLIERGQVEILAGGYFEPILSMVPADDAKGQIRMLIHSIKKHFNFNPKGVWLAERVWDPALPSIFKDLNIKYTILDDFHFRQSSKKDDEIYGHYSVKGFEGFSVFASIKKLRYAIPFREPGVTIEFLKNLRGNPKASSVTFADDCEKLGFWPYTYNWVYKKGWLEKFFRAIEENNWINTLTFSEALEKCSPLGDIDIPHSSYAEMIEWCNGNFNNFFEKYPESNLMRKRMLYVSHKIANSRKDAISANDMQKVEKAKEELYKSQSNCAYWHGVFGGLYVRHLRSGIYRHIIKAEDVLRGDKEGFDVEMVNFKNNPDSIICAQNKFLTLFIDPNYAGSLFEIDYKPLSYNLINTMSRRYEPYHEKLKRKQKFGIHALKKKVDNEESIDLYEVLGVRERNLARFLNYDSYRKFSALCHITDLKTRLSDFVESSERIVSGNSLFGPHDHEVKNENGRLIINLQRKGSSSGQFSQLRLNKCIILERDAEIFMKFDLENISSKRAKFIFGVEFNWLIEDNLFLQRKSKRRIREIALVDRFSGLKIKHVFEEPVNFWSFPVYTVNESERGLEKTFQGISILAYKKLTLCGNGKFSLAAKIRISG